MSSSNCCFLTCIQISASHLFKNLPQSVVVHTVKGFGVVNEAKVDAFLVLSCFFNNPTDVGYLISGSSAFSECSLKTWKFTVHVLLKPGLENFDHYFPSMWYECNCVVVWTFFGIAFLWDWNEIWPFPVLWATAEFSKFPYVMSMLFLCPSLSVSIFMSQRRQWHPTPVLLPGKPHGRRSLVGCSPWGREESDTTVTSLSLFIFMHWRRKWQPTPVFLPGESQGRGSLAGCCLWGRTESDTTEAT